LFFEQKKLIIFVYFSIVTYNDSTRPIIQLFEKENLVKRIDAANDVDKVFDDVQKVFNNFQ